MEEKVWIDVDQLVIDHCNVRRGKWEYDEEDEELTRDVKERMIETPLKVRRLSIEGVKKYGIVRGGRRYNAAITAGFTEVPCIIENWDDTEARIQSLRENRLRKNNPKWMDIEQVGEILEGMGDKEILENKTRKLSKRSSLSVGTVQRYHDIYTLPEAVRELLRKPEDRSPWLKEYLMVLQKRKSSKTLTLGNITLIARELKDFPPAKQMEVASFLLDKPYDKAEKLIEYVKKYPEEPLEELYDKILTGASKISKNIYLDRKTNDSLSDACMDRQTFYYKLIEIIIREWLIDKGYLTSGDSFVVEGYDETRIGEVSFKIGNRRVKIQPTIQIDGYPPIFFSIKEVKEKAWNKNQKLPRQLVEFLNNLQIKYR